MTAAGGEAGAISPLREGGQERVLRDAGHAAGRLCPLDSDRLDMPAMRSDLRWLVQVQEKTSERNR
jgi:hypothetical protein